MVLFSRAFIRKRVISLVTTASVSATSLALAQDPARTHHAHDAKPIPYVVDWPDHSEEQPFLSENAAAMKKMMADMTIKPTGDVERDFLTMMMPDHQGAVDMAQAELKYGQNEQLRRLAQEIVLSQQQEIAVMRLALGDKPPRSAAAPAPAGVATASRGGAMSSSIGSHAAMSHRSIEMR